MSKQTLMVAGITVNVFSLSTPDTESSATAEGANQKPVAILFLLHGRTSRADHVELVAKAILDEVYAKRKSEEGKAETHDLLVVTFDHRNHGSRLVDEKANMAWSDSRRNDRHAIDMYAIQTGTAQDVSFLIDFLPSYLFPNGERVISQWLVSGISLGGHSTWITLKIDPRVKLGIPIIGCPDYLTLIRSRAEQSSIPIGPPYFPDSFMVYLKRNDPAATPHTAADAENPFRGKKILVLCGQEDTLVPWSASKQFVEELDVGEQEGGLKTVVVEPGVGHTCSPGMVKEAVRFLWRNALTSI
ncbi:Alpha/Beta hydrolase protein [Daedaleopsis nitida]|nr:Alpha/Beta hydrolase protein [Daedaleopsis nitida]